MGELLVLSRKEIEEILDMEMAIKAVESAYRQKSLGKGSLFPLVTHVFEEGKADMDIKSGHLSESGLFGFKVVSWFDENTQKALPKLFGTMMVFDDATGEPLALLNAGPITAMRTGAAGAVGAKYLANEEAGTMLMMGTGAQAAYQIAALLTVKPEIRRVFLASPHGPERARERAAEIQGEVERLLRGKKRDYRLLLVEDLEQAVRESEILVTATISREPLIQKEWVMPGMHFSCIGADMEGKQEIDGRILGCASVFVDDRKQAETVGECEVPIKQGLLAPEDFKGEIGEVIAGMIPGRTAKEEITVFDSSGIGLQDLTLAGELVDYAKKNGKGRWITL
ncbi:MAG: ornithine cyclodeaminase family protein [Eubacteriales bacterium]|nr:ornithine cyclodeaminase family protein [Eubacteriales bacterium]